MLTVTSINSPAKKVRNSSMARPCPLLSFLSFFFFFLPCLSCPEDQKQALLQFKSSILAATTSFNSSNFELQSWNSSSSCCRWLRVECNDSPNSTSRVVISLDLMGGLYIYPSPEPPLPSTILAPIFHIRSLKWLYISNNNIQGEIPAVGFANLSNLQNSTRYLGSCFGKPFLLPLMSNNLLSGGKIPEEIGNLSRLQDLSLSGNNFSGSIPSQLFHLPLLNFVEGGLEFLDLSDNDLSTEIPTEIGNLPNISTLALSNNRLTGGIPSSMQKLSKLEQLYLQNNLLTGEIPSWLFHFKGLQDLNLGGNRLNWNDSVKIAPNSRLRLLSLKSCGLVGEIPKWISTQTNLYFLDLSKNKLQGALPQWFLEMRRNGLILSDNEFTGSLPPSLFSGASLGVLALSRNNFSGELPKNIGDATSLEILTLSENNFSGPIPQSLIKVPYLQFLDLSRNRFFGPFPVFDPEAAQLSYIDFSSNDFSGEVPTTFPKETIYLALGGNKFSGGLPLNLTNLSKLERLELQDNKLTGELPNSLSQISTLQVLNLRNNSFQGLIPESIFNLSNLRILDVSSNNLTGEIPKESRNLVGMIRAQNSPSSILPRIAMSYTNNWPPQEVPVPLEIEDLIVNWKNSKQGIPSDNLNMYTLLDLSNNQLSGQIPASLGALKALKLLNISRNKLSGKIPTSFGDLENIESLDLSHNKLSGSIPLTLTKLQQLTILDVSNNQLTGRIPDGGQMGTMVLDPNYYANNSGLCGMQIHVSCPEDEPLRPTKLREHDNKVPWFLWEGVWIGYPVGLLLAIGIIFLTGPPPSNRRHRPHRPIRRWN
ncbi:Receptor-like protein 12 [Vitis vinifera]|uniref:Receptor-like protein 12 n=1 Tax=Vitis vinifera TaxID=29760 RepID=A0A438JV24_VITVI|nr:Receptor-like protein 12 [Vitis vinifera]